VKVFHIVEDSLKVTLVTVLILLLLPLAALLLLTPVNATSPCPTGLTASKTLTADCTGTIYIAANGVTLNCNSFTVSGPGTFGVEVAERLHVTVENCKIAGFTEGLYVAGTNSSTFKNNNATANTLYGVYVTLNKTATGSSKSNTFSGNVAKSNDEGFFIRGSYGNALTSNAANSNGDNGFYFYESNGNTLTSNTANSNYEGFDFGYSSGNTLTSNTATSNTNNGFDIYRSNGNTLTSNTANTNTYDGFVIYYSNGTTLTSNTANSNYEGFDITGSTGNTLKSNTANSNHYGFELTYQSQYNVLSSNVAKSNSYDGFYFDSTTSENWAVSNSASGNAKYDAEQATGASNLFFTNSFTHTSGI
jgi:parallel beta-helix repeat protein